MTPKTIENGVLITAQQYERFRKMKGYKNATAQKYDVIYTMVFRLLILSELLNSEIYKREDIERDMELTISELYSCCENYREIIRNFDDCEF